VRWAAAATAIAAATAFVPSWPAAAHKLPVQRALYLEPAGDTLHVASAITVPGGAARAALTALAKGESELKGILIRRALDGVRLASGTSTLTLSGVESKLRAPDSPAEPLELMLHGTAPLPRDAARVVLRVSTEPFGDPLLLVVLPGTRPVEQTSRGRLKGGGFKAELTVADEVRWTLGPPG
jgi:hypothetical protein